MNRKKFTTLMAALSVIFLLLAPPSAAGAGPDPSATLYCLQGQDVYRLFPEDGRCEKMLSGDGGELFENISQAGAAGGSLAWPAGRGGRNYLATWDGGKLNLIPLEKHETAVGFEVLYEEGEMAGLEPHFVDTYLGEYLVSPQGRQVVWNVNAVTGMTVEDAGTVTMKHLVFSADVGGGHRRLVIEDDFSFTGLFADRWDTRHLLGWSKRQNPGLYFFNFVAGQLFSAKKGLFSLSLSSGEKGIVDENIEVVLALSPDEKRAAWTPNDESCCGGLNYTNNILVVRELDTGKETTVYDEWAEFGNLEFLPGDSGTGEEHYPTGAFFSPDGKKLAFTLDSWPGRSEDQTARDAWVRQVDTGASLTFRGDRTVIGWLDNDRLILGRPAEGADDERKMDSLYLFSLGQKKESRLPGENVVILGFDAPGQ